MPHKGGAASPQTPKPKKCLAGQGAGRGPGGPPYHGGSGLRYLVMRYLLVLFLLASAHAQKIEFNVVNPDVLKERLRMAHPKNNERYARLKSLFEQTGCSGEVYHEQKVSGSKQPNLICQVPGNQESPRRIIVGAHFDSIGGDGIVDNWSGAVLLPSLAEFMRRSPRRHTFEFVAFAGEEQGLLGSSNLRQEHPKSRAPTNRRCGYDGLAWPDAYQVLVRWFH